MGKKLKNMTDTNLLLTITIVVFFVMYIGAIVFQGKGFLKPQTFFNILNANAALIILSCGMSLVMITGGIDISVGGVVALVSMSCAVYLDFGGGNVFVSMLLAVAIGLAFGIVVVNVIRQMGVDDDTAIAKEVLHSGILAGVLMALIYMLTILMGAQSLGLFAVSENGGIALSQISSHYLGRAGLVILAVTITFACLKTSIGLVTSCSETFVQMFPDKLSYKAWAIIFTLFSFIGSNMGLSTIIRYSVPVLMLIYPPAIALILLAMFGEHFHHDRKVYVWVTALTWAASLFDFFKTLPEQVQVLFHLDKAVTLAQTFLPLFNLNLGWILPAMVGMIIGLGCKRNEKRRRQALA